MECFFVEGFVDVVGVDGVYVVVGVILFVMFDSDLYG